MDAGGGGELRGFGTPTIADVAKAAGVSPMTVSRVINGGHSVREATRERVAQAISALRFVPNPAARALARGDKLRIGVLYAPPPFGIFTDFLIGALNQASSRSAELIIQGCDMDAGVGSALDWLGRSRLDGVVVTPPLADWPPLLDALKTGGAPVVAIATSRAPDWALSVCIDDFRAAFDMTEHLLALGHRRIGFIVGNPIQSASAERLAGHVAALAAAGLPDDPELIADGLFTYRSGLAAAEELLARPSRPSAIFASNDDMAAAVVAVAHRRGLDVPRDLTVCGFDDAALATSIFPELTTIRQPIMDMARLALDLLIGEIRSRSSKTPASRPKHLVVDHQLIRRESHAAPHGPGRAPGTAVSTPDRLDPAVQP